MQTLTASLTNKARELGFTTIGIIPAQPARRLDAYLQWIAAEMHGRMGYLARPDRVIRRQDLNVIVPDVKTIICVGVDYFTMRVPEAIAADPSRGRLSNYAWGVDYHDVMTPRLNALAAWLAAEADSDTSSTQSRVYVDTGAILERDHAESAGLGFTGKNTMLIHPRRGSFFFLGEILTTLEISDQRSEIEDAQIPIANRQSPISQTPSCGRCRRCLDACPTAAFPEPYVLDARRCISYLTIELKGWIPQSLRPLMGNWIYGCDVCQEVCPFNRFAQPTHENLFYPGDKRLKIRDSSNLPSPIFNPQSLAYIAPPLLELLLLDNAGFKERFANSPIKRIRRPRFLRNVCVAIGNWGSPTAVSPLSQLLSDPEPIIRGHAAWALRQIGTTDAHLALTRALAEETDERVLQELTS